MRYLFISLIIVAVLFPAIAFSWTGEIIRIKDGDTIVVRKGSSNVDVRLYGIDTPESSQWYGQKAKTFLANQISDKTVSVKDMGTGIYGRTIGLVSVGNLNINRQLVKYGYAWVYDRYCNKQFCSKWNRLEEKARRQEKGLWKNPNVIPPWEYRHGGGSQQSQSSVTEDKNCSDSDTQAEAQRFFEKHQPGDPHNLNGNNDRGAWEELP